MAVAFTEKNGWNHGLQQIILNTIQKKTYLGYYKCGIISWYVHLWIVKYQLSFDSPADEP